MENTDSTLVETFPAELWLIIFDWFMDSCVGMQGRCNYINFPEMLLTLRHLPVCWIKGNPWAVNLRLVCRRFNSLLEMLPVYFKKDGESAIPAGVRAVSINACNDSNAYLQRILADPLRTYQIRILDLPGPANYRSSCPFLFELLCENAGSLPGLRSLSIGLWHPTSSEMPTTKFWSRLNDSFPKLVCLILLGTLKTTPEAHTITFENLEVLDMGLLRTNSTIHFPSLRHVAFGSMSSIKLENFSSWRLLDSLILRHIDNDLEFKWNLVPNLRLLAIPSDRVGDFAPHSSECPLEHLYLNMDIIPRWLAERGDIHYNRKSEETMWMRERIERLPSVKRITCAWVVPDVNTSSSIWGLFDEHEINRLGFTSDASTNSPTRGRRTILERSSLGSASEDEKIIPRKKGGRWGVWVRVYRFVARRFHL